MGTVKVELSSILTETLIRTTRLIMILELRRSCGCNEATPEQQ